MRILDSNQTPKTPKIQQQSPQTRNLVQELMPAHITKNPTSLSAASPILEIPFLQTGFIKYSPSAR